ncbi:hypothetical protein [Gracilimonas sp. BCB1]|uniref:hypothetical protein n=1 Tax=Gracilimonas sp. BCB1 TaxID=3152362 RepID=UPI0032D92210
MKIPVNALGVAYDYEEVLPGKNTIDFFAERFEGSDTDTKRIEQVLVRWLFTRSSAKKLLYSVLDLYSDAHVKFEISEPFSEREFDVLSWNQNAPEQAIAIECKRAKIKRESFQNNDVTGLKKLAEGVIQSRKLLKVGFYKTHLLIMTVVDGRDRTMYNQLSRGANEKQFNKIIDFPNRSELPEEVGLLFVEIVQTTDAPLSRTGFISVSVAKPPIPQVQKRSTTEKIVLFSNN